MPVTIKKSQLMYKNPSTGEYVSVDAVADKTSQQQINGINTAASNAIASINTAMQDIDTQPLTTLPKKAYKKDLVANEETLASAATHAYAVGDYFFVADNNNDISLYKATAAIAVGNTISPGTGIDNNCVPAALANDVTSLSNDLDNISESLGDLSDLETESKTNLVSAINKAAQSGLSDMVKQALLVCFDHVAWDNNNGQNYYDALESALYPQGDLEVISISATYTQSANVYPDTGLESLKDDLVVTAHYDNSSTQILHKNFYSLSGTLTSGTSTITVTYDGKTTTFNVNVTTWDSYNYSISNGQIVKVTGSTIVMSNYKNDIQLDSADSKRRSFPTTRGVRPFLDRRNGYAALGYYPIPIPDDAIGAVVTITPATQYHGAAFYTYTNSGGYVKLEGLGLGWEQGSKNYVFANLSSEDIKFITVAGKYDSSGGTYSEEPSELTVEFYKE